MMRMRVTMRGEETIEELVERAVHGERRALESIVVQVQDDIYRLALRMLYHPHDAEDAAQEILIKVITHLSSFRGDCAFTTWVYRIAANHLMRAKRRRSAKYQVDMKFMVDHVVTEAPPSIVASMAPAERKLLELEVKLSCLQAMLLCLTRKQRLAFVLGTVCELPGPEAAEVMELTTAAYRKLLSRARQRVLEYVRAHCSEFAPGSRCVCERQIASGLSQGWVRQGALRFATAATSTNKNDAPRESREQLKQLGELRRLSYLFQSHPSYSAPGRVAEGVGELIREGRFSVLQD